MTKQSALVEETRREAYAKHGKPYPPASAPAVQPCPLLPISICVADTSGTVITEQILWRLGDPTWEPKGVAGRMCQDLSLPPDMEREVEEQIRWSLRGVQQWRELGGEKRVQLQIQVRQGDQVFRDSVEWDLNNPINSPAAYAARVCKELDLELSWYDAICAYMSMRIEECIKDLQSSPSSVELLPPVESAVRQSPAAGGGAAAGRLPRIEAYSAEADVEAARLRARAQRQQQQ